LERLRDCRADFGLLVDFFPALPITPDIAARAMDFDLPQGDPFDRVIAATAQYHALPLQTRDAHLSARPGIRTISK